MSKDKKIISVTLDPKVISLLDTFSGLYGFTRSSALNFILKNVLSVNGTASVIDDMRNDMHNMNGSMGE